MTTDYHPITTPNHPITTTHYALMAVVTTSLHLLTTSYDSITLGTIATTPIPFVTTRLPLICTMIPLLATPLSLTTTPVPSTYCHPSSVLRICAVLFGCRHHSVVRLHNITTPLAISMQKSLIEVAQAQEPAIAPDFDGGPKLLQSKDPLTHDDIKHLAHAYEEKAKEAVKLQKKLTKPKKTASKSGYNPKKKDENASTRCLWRRWVPAKVGRHG